jgi:excisionase family DNA binding protein
MEIKVRTDDLVSVAQAAKALGKPRLTIYRWIGAKKMIGIKLGGILYVPKTEIEKWKETEKATAAGR